MKKGVFNKKGFFLAEETMKIILAVICLGFLIFVLGKMYYSYTADKEVQQAKDTLSRIEKEINSMKEGEKRDIIIYSPNSWFLVGFGKQEMPVFCSEKKWESCLCICEKITKLDTFSGKTAKDKCDNICVSFSEKVSAPQIDIENPPITILVSKSSGTISFFKK